VGYGNIETVIRVHAFLEPLQLIKNGPFLIAYYILITLWYIFYYITLSYYIILR